MSSSQPVASDSSYDISYAIDKLMNFLKVNFRILPNFFISSLSWFLENST